jgi:hypothetical protein
LGSLSEWLWDHCDFDRLAAFADQFTLLDTRLGRHGAVRKPIRLVAGQPPDQYQAPALGGALTVAGWYKSTRTAVVLGTPTTAQVAALLDKGYTVIDMSDPVQWSVQFGQYPLVFGGMT